MAWSPPEAPQYKINYDAATFAEDNNASLGVVIQNNEGRVMASLTQQIPLPATVIEIKALAARRVMEFALEIGHDNIVLEGNNESRFKAFEEWRQKLGTTRTPYKGHSISQLTHFCF